MFTYDIDAAIAAGTDDDEIVAEIMRDARCDEVMARSILSREKGEPQENWDDCVLP